MPAPFGTVNYLNNPKKKRVLSHTRFPSERNPNDTPASQRTQDGLELHRCRHPPRGDDVARAVQAQRSVQKHLWKGEDNDQLQGQKAIADILGEKPEDLWPSRYPKGGPRILDTNKFTPVDSQKAPVATDKRAVA